MKTINFRGIYDEYLKKNKDKYIFGIMKDCYNEDCTRITISGTWKKIKKCIQEGAANVRTDTRGAYTIKDNILKYEWEQGDLNETHFVLEENGIIIVGNVSDKEVKKIKKIIKKMQEKNGGE